MFYVYLFSLFTARLFQFVLIYPEISAVSRYYSISRTTLERFLYCFNFFYNFLPKLSCYLRFLLSLVLARIFLLYKRVYKQNCTGKIILSFLTLYMLRVCCFIICAAMRLTLYAYFHLLTNLFLFRSEVLSM